MIIRGAVVAHVAQPLIMWLLMLLYNSTFGSSSEISSLATWFCKLCFNIHSYMRACATLADAKPERVTENTAVLDG